MVERRNSRRTKSFLRGFVYVSRKRGALACLIRDLSEKGARIVFSDQVTLPDVVDLYIPQHSAARTDAPRARALAPQRRDRARFHRRRTRSGSAAERRRSGAARRHAEAEIASLRTLLKRLKGGKDGANDEAAA